MTLKPCSVQQTRSDEEGLLVFYGDHRLVAELSHLSEDNEVAPGQ